MVLFSYSYYITFLRGAVLDRRPPVAVSCFLRFYQPLYYSYALRGPCFFVMRFYRHCIFGRPSGGPLSVLTERGERATKGLQSRPLESGFFIRGFGGETCGLFYVFARVQLTRFRPVRGVLRTASTDSIVLLQLRRIRNTYRITGLICGRKLGLPIMQ